MEMNSEAEMGYADCVDSATPPDIPFSGKYKRSLAYIAIKDRLPIILTQVVDQLSRDKEEIIKHYGKETQQELKIIIGSFSKLKNELQTNKPFIPLSSNSPNVALWNTYLKEQSEAEGTEPRWYASTFIYVECYMYRRVQEAFELSKSLATFDPFRKKKELALHNSLGAVTVLASRMVNLHKDELKDSNLKDTFLTLLHVNLWGNRCDLSSTAGEEIILHEDPFEKVTQLEEFLLVDNSNGIWDILSSRRGSSKDVTLDIIMDNAGYEIITDFCLADLIISFSVASKVRFRCKAFPWFVSDACIEDFHWTLQTLCASEDVNISSLANRWCDYLASGKWTLIADEFWTFPHVYSEMQAVDSKLYNELSQSTLVIFKGDLNYRKLLGDINWHPTKPFPEALCGFLPTNIAVLRTLKSDVICGLSPGQAEEVAAKSSDWRVSGNYAVIQLSSTCTCN